MGFSRGNAAVQNLSSKIVKEIDSDFVARTETGYTNESKSA